MVFTALNFGYVRANVDYWWQRLAGGGYSETITDATAADRIYIPSLGIDAPLVYTEATDERGFQDALGAGVVHYPNTAMVGEGGNAYFFGHSSDFPTKAGEYKTVFALLPKIANGAQVILTNDKGKEYVYEVFETHVVAPTDTHWLAQGDGKEKLLTLQTSYPVGTALKRFLVRARLVE